MRIMSLDMDIEKILAKDLGPSAPSFLKRQCESHLGKSADKLTRADLEELAKWCFIGVKLTLGVDTAEKVKRGVLSVR
jgi:hypothetical protein